jgi:nucleoside-diphosphate-sugar epimerase
MPRAAVTGSSGKLGRAVVDHLHDSGWDVVALDQAAPARDGITSTRVDLTDFGQTYEALAGMTTGTTASTPWCIWRPFRLPVCGRTPRLSTRT